MRAMLQANVTGLPNVAMSQASRESVKYPRLLIADALFRFRGWEEKPFFY